MRNLAHILRVLGIFYVLFCLNGCGFKNAVLFPTPEAPQPIQNRYVILLLIDGAVPDEVNKLVRAGRLPHFQDLFYENGARFENAISVLPTVSTPAHQAFISGLFPGRHGIPNLDWFSRPLEKYIDYLKPTNISLTNTYMFNFKQVEAGSIRDDTPQLIYHDLRSHPTMSVFEPANSGATYILPKRPPFLTAYHGKMEKFYEALDLRAMKLTLDAFRTLPLEQVPRFSYVSCYSMDLVGHFSGTQSPRAEDLYLLHDRFLGELRQTLQQRGIWEKSTLVLVSDHGQHALSKTTDLPALLSRIGLTMNKKRPSQSQVMWGDHGTGFSNLYFKIGKDWSQAPSLEQLRHYPIPQRGEVDLVAAFSSHPDIEFVVARESTQRTKLFRKDQSGTIETRQRQGLTEYAYLPDGAGDPLGYKSDPAIAPWMQGGEFHSAEDWLKHTHDKPLPDAVVLLSQLFDDGRVGDLLLFTVKDSQFKETRLSGHGSMNAEDLRILMMLHGPDILPGVYPYARTVDLYPTLLKLFGLSARAPQDGIVRREILRDKSKDAPENPPTGMTPQRFSGKIQQALETGQWKDEQRQKALQLLYSMDPYLKHGNETANAARPSVSATQKP